MSCLDGLGVVIVDKDAVQAVRLWGASATVRAQLNIPRAVTREATYQARVAVARQRLGSARFDALWREGTMMTGDEATLCAADRDDAYALISR